MEKLHCIRLPPEERFSSWRWGTYGVRNSLVSTWAAICGDYPVKKILDGRRWCKQGMRYWQKNMKFSKSVFY
ncbi:MAG: hypothetical protein DBX53_04120 [Clostridiales bacterium]|nr:MAG: hypothetical protein DBX53_04120 [Clostridiales bacterium]